MRKKKLFSLILLLGTIFFTGRCFWGIKVSPENTNFVYVKGGSFETGSNEAWKSDANPVHRVTVDSFYLSKYEVTFEEYDKFCEEMKKDKPPDQGMGSGWIA